MDGVGLHLQAALRPGGGLPPRLLNQHGHGEALVQDAQLALRVRVWWGGGRAAQPGGAKGRTRLVGCGGGWRGAAAQQSACAPPARQSRGWARTLGLFLSAGYMKMPP
jgi:hypothetical protein